MVSYFGKLVKKVWKSWHGRKEEMKMGKQVRWEEGGRTEGEREKWKEGVDFIVTICCDQHDYFRT